MLCCFFLHFFLDMIFHSVTVLHAKLSLNYRQISDIWADLEHQILKYRKTDINAHFKLIWDDILLVPKKDKKYQYMV